MITYHISKISYEEGERYSIDDYDGLSHFHKNLSEVQQMINFVIDDHRPNNAPSRTKCFYTFLNEDDCIGYVDNLEGYSLYKVEVDPTNPCPMALIILIDILIILNV